LIGLEEALDVANTVAVVAGVERDVLAPDGEFERWAAAAAKSPAFTPDEAAAIRFTRERLLKLRDAIRAVIAAIAASRAPSATAAAEIAASSAGAPSSAGHPRALRTPLGAAPRRLTVPAESDG
jgi:Putative stress-induced transcription regulator